LLILWAIYFASEHQLFQPEGRSNTAAGVTTVGIDSDIQRALADLATYFSLSVILVECIAVVGLPILFLSGAINEERSRGTLDLLWASHLSDLEIVVGKLLGRVAAAGMVLLVGLPLLALVQFWGGVGFQFLVGAFACLLITLFSVGSLTLFWSAHCRAQFETILLTSVCCLGSFVYGIFVTGSVANPLLFLMDLDAQLHGQRSMLPSVSRLLPMPRSNDPNLLTLQLLVDYVFVHSLIIVFCLHHTIRRLRRWTLLPPPVRIILASQRPSAFAVPFRSFRRRSLFPAEASHPLWWRETATRLAGFNDLVPVLYLYWWVCAGGYSFLTLTRMIGATVGNLQPMTVEPILLAFVATFLTAGISCCLVSVPAATTITRERMQ
jgi:ABC-type transport system involved in multi-copper enzyme maturation permease subunit